MSKSKQIKGKSVPTKTTLNLVIKEKKPLRLSRVIPAVLIVLIVAAAFAKFAVIDRYAALGEAERQLTLEREHLEDLRLSYADYEEVQAEYNQYSYAEFDRSIPDRQDVFHLLEKHVFPVSGMRQLAISGRSMSMTLTGMSLEEVSTLIAQLEAEPLVERVTVSTTGYANGDDGVPTASMMVFLADATTLEGGEGNA